MEVRSGIEKSKSAPIIDDITGNGVERSIMDQLERLLWFYVLPIAISFGVALLMYRLSEPIARRVVPMWALSRRRRKRTALQQKAREETLISLVAGIMTVIAVLVASFVSLAQFISVDTLVWMIGLFGAGLGFSAKPFISDYMTGIAFIADDIFDVGEKVEILEIEGVVEAVTLRMTTVRGLNGEVYIIPNGEIRTVRNFSRGRYTPVRVTVRVPSSQLSQTIPILEQLGQTALDELPDLLEPWKVLVEEARVGQNTELTLVSKATFGKGAELRPHMLAWVQEHLQETGIQVVE
jgi:small-conductance mechanosensitive channel